MCIAVILNIAACPMSFCFFDTPAMLVSLKALCFLGALIIFANIKLLPLRGIERIVH